MQTNIFVDKKERTGKPHELFGIWMDGYANRYIRTYLWCYYC